MNKKFKVGDRVRHKYYGDGVVKGYGVGYTVENLIKDSGCKWSVVSSPK